MKKYSYIDEKGTFQLSDPELTSYLYFPIANESGVLSCVTPCLGGDSKLDQNTFLLEPVSSENLHNNKCSRNFWCNIKNSGVWSATGKSASQQAELFTANKDETILEAGFMWQKVTRHASRYQISSQIVSFVPYGEELCEFMIVTIRNEGNNTIEMTPTAAIPIFGRSADNIRDHRHVTSLLHRITTVKNGVLVNPTLSFDERGHKKNQIVYGVFGKDDQGENPDGFYPCVEDYIGEGGSFENPKAIYEQYSLQSEQFMPAGVVITGQEAMGGIRFKETKLKAGESKTYKIILVYGNSEKELESVAKKYLEEISWESCLKSTSEYWNKKINIDYKSGNHEFDYWMHWVNFQPILRRIYGCSFLPHHDYGKGGRGWRDLWQDCLALLIMNPDEVRDMLIDNFGGVRFDGTNATIIGKNQGEFLADRNNITRVWMDHGAWPVLTMELYIMQTGDLDILFENVGYFKDLQIMRGGEKDRAWSPSHEKNNLLTQSGFIYQGTILEHILVQHLTAFYDVGEHNHMRLHDADWNDALDMAKERGESVAFTNLYAKNLKTISEILKRVKLKKADGIVIAKELELLLCNDVNLYNSVVEKRKLLSEYCQRCNHNISGEKVEISIETISDNLLQKAEWMKQHIRETEWISNKEGYSWFNGYYDNSGRQVEGDFQNQTRILLTSQVFSIMAETASDDQVKEIVKTTDKYLYDLKVGGYRLNTDFVEIKMDMGRMFGFAYGTKENGAVFSHMAIMYANALYQRGFAKEGYKVIHSLFTHCSNFEISKIYPGVPEYIGDNGRGLYHYLTGAASWLLLTVLTEMYGIKGYYGDLYINPKILAVQFDENRSVTIDTNFANRKLIITYINENLKEYGEYQIGKIMIDNETYDSVLNENCISRKKLEGLNKETSHIITAYLI